MMKSSEVAERRHQQDFEDIRALSRALGVNADDWVGEEIEQAAYRMGKTVEEWGDGARLLLPCITALKEIDWEKVSQVFGQTIKRVVKE